MKPNKNQKRTINKSSLVKRESQDLTKSLSNLFDGVSEPNTDPVVKKLDLVLDLTSANVSRSRELSNFPTEEYQKDNTAIFDIKIKYTSTDIKDPTDFKFVNQIYHKHNRLAKLMT